MLHKSLKLAENFLDFSNVRAHCDIPCQIYDPSTAIIASLSVIRMMDILIENNTKGREISLVHNNAVIRCIQRKEEESEKVKREIRIIWGDYFKTPQLESFPQIHDLTHQIMVIASACKQKIDRNEAEQLLELVNQFAEIFWATKDLKSDRKVAPYPPGLPVVYPQL